MNTKKGYVLLLVVCMGAASLMMSCHWGKKVGWMDLNKVYNEFELKKELEARLEITRQSKKKVLDSLEFEIIMLTKRANGKADQEHIQDSKEYYIKKKRMFDVEDESTKAEYQSQIFKQMNQFVKDFGEKNEYQLIMSAEGSGALMYADKDIDLTVKIIQYINERYKGVQK